MAPRRRMKAPPYAPSRSRMMYLGGLLQPRAIHSALGCAVTPSHRISRRECCRTRNPQEPKRNRGNNKQVYRRDGISMTAKEDLPTLRWWPPSLCHIFSYGRLADIDAKLEQLAVNPWRSPQRVGNAHLANELTNVHGRLWPAAARSVISSANTPENPRAGRSRA